MQGTIEALEKERDPLRAIDKCFTSHSALFSGGCWGIKFPVEARRERGSLWSQKTRGIAAMVIAGASGEDFQGRLVPLASG